MTKTEAPLRILLLGGGRMGATHAETFDEIAGAEVVAIADPADADGFARTHGIARSFPSLEAALDWGDFDAVANVTPDAVHAPTTLTALDAGKHVFCEKPLAPTYGPARAMADAARRTGRICMVNLTYRQVPAMQMAARLVADGAIGTLRHFEASYLQSWLTQPLWGDWRTEDAWLWRLSTRHGSTGVLGDVGVHILDFASYVAGDGIDSVSCRLKTFAKAAGDRIGAYTLDANDSAVMTVELAGGALGTIHASRFASGHLNDLKLRLYGTDGGLEVEHRRSGDVLKICRAPDLETAIWTDVTAPPVSSNYARFVAAVAGTADPDPDFDRGAALQQVIDAAVQSDAEDGCRIAVSDIA